MLWLKDRVCNNTFQINVVAVVTSKVVEEAAHKEIRRGRKRVKKSKQIAASRA